MEPNIKDLKDSEQQIESIDAKIDEPDKSRSRHGNRSWIPGLVLIAIGVVFLLQNFTDFRLNNWWALFILIPAFGSLGKFVHAYRSNGRINGEARGPLIGGLILLFIASVFLFGWSWGLVWPVMLIIAGIGALLSGLFG